MTWLWPWAPTSSCWAGTSPFDESPTNKVIINGNYMKEYWGEGSNFGPATGSAMTWAATKLSFEEGVDSYMFPTLAA